jgi:VWFA-related protein
MASTLVGFLGLAFLSHSQQPPTPPLTIPEAVGQIVIVDARVIDSLGRPVTDLRQEDFELSEDTKRVPIVAFRSPSVEMKDLGSEARDTGTSAVPPLKAEGEPFTVAIYVDRWLLSPPGRKRALDQAASLAAAHIAQGAQVLVIGDEKGLRALTPLTRDAEAVRAALTHMQGWATASPGVIEGRQVQDNIKAVIELAESSRACPDRPPCLCVLPQLVSMVRSYASARAAEVRGAGDRLSFLVNALGSLPGLKALIFVSDGLEQRPGIHLYDQIGSICPEALHREFSTITSAMQEFETSPPLREAAARANAARVTLYPIDARGLTGFSAGDISQADRRYVPTPRNDSIKDANLVNPLELLAEETGGFAILRGPDPPSVMKRFDADERGHYVLGFTPGDPDGQVHALQVKLTPAAASRVKAGIRHRMSYRRAVLPDRRGQRALATMIFGLEENSLGVEAEVERTSATTAQVRVVLLLSSLKEAPGKGEAHLKLVVSFRTAGDEKAPPMVRETSVTLPMGAAELEKEGGLRELIVDVPLGGGGFDFVIGVEDVSSGRSTYLKRAVSPEETGETLHSVAKPRS